MADYNPLLTLFLETYPDGATLGQLESFVESALKDLNNLELFDPETGAVVDSNRTIFYSGTIGSGPDGVYTGNIAVDMASRAPEPTRVIDNTKIGRFFTAMTLDGALNEAVQASPGVQASADIIARTANFEKASKLLAETAKGDVIAIIGDDANPGKVFGTTELPALLKNSAASRRVRDFTHHMPSPATRHSIAKPRRIGSTRNRRP